MTQITRISKFRSCFGHNFAGRDTDGIPETDRSMKHYFQILSSVNGSNKIELYSPFDGTVAYADARLDAPAGWQLGVVASADPSQEVVFFHIVPIAGITARSVIKAGQLLGFAQPPDGVTFDIAYGYPAGYYPVPQTLDSLFNHMTPAVLAQYAAKGLTPQNASISKAARDAQPCQYPNGGIGSPLQDPPDNWVTFR